MNVLLGKIMYNCSVHEVDEEAHFHLVLEEEKGLNFPIHLFFFLISRIDTNLDRKASHLLSLSTDMYIHDYWNAYVQI